MWDADGGIEVVIKPYGSPDAYHEWKAPSHSDLHQPNGNECFFEAVTGERFMIRIILHQSFSWKRQKAVSVRVNLDDTFEAIVFFTKPEDKRPQTLTEDVESFVHTDETGASISGFTFGKVEVVDDPSFLSRDQETDELSKRGKIRIEIVRGRFKTRKRNELEKSEDRAPPSALIIPERTTKMVCMDNGRSHMTRPIALRKYEPKVFEFMEVFRQADAEADDGDGPGKLITLTFFYTSREYMEIQGIMPLIFKSSLIEEAILIDDDAPTPPPPDTTTRHVHTSDVAFTSAQPVKGSQGGRKRVKREDESEEEPQQTSPSFPGTGMNPDCADQDDDEPLPNQMIKTEQREEQSQNRSNNKRARLMLELEHSQQRKRVEEEKLRALELRKQLMDLVAEE